MKAFTDREGRNWHALVREEPGTDYKGRFFLVIRADGESGREHALEDVRWNTERTAARTLETMSEVELRRRLRSALGRGRMVPN
jgi:hypothetical protein